MTCSVAASLKSGCALPTRVRSLSRVDFGVDRQVTTSPEIFSTEITRKRGLNCLQETGASLYVSLVNNFIQYSQLSCAISSCVYSSDLIEKTWHHILHNQMVFLRYAFLRACQTALCLETFCSKCHRLFHHHQLQPTMQLQLFIEWTLNICLYCGASHVCVYYWGL